jgi:enoyl-CoA hydratase/carnithine racemase
MVWFSDGGRRERAMSDESGQEKAVLVHQRDGVGHILLNRPAAMNAVNIELAEQLEEGVLRLGGDEAVKVIVIRGSGGHFSVGGDFNEVEQLRSGGAAAIRPLFESFGRACGAIGAIEVPVIAAVEGYAMAGGFELLLAADIVLVRDDAKLADNHSNFGQIPGGGSSQRLPRLVGRQRALGLMLSGNRLSGAQAAEWGLAYRSFPADEFDTAVESFAASLAGKSRAALSAMKRLVYGSAEGSLADGLAEERRLVVEFISGDAGAVGIEQFKTRGA